MMFGKKKKQNSAVFDSANVIDFHAHVLPKIDDGSSSVEETLAMLAAAKEQNLSAIVATPHFYPEDESPQFFLKRRRASCERLLEVYDPEKHPTLYLGAEVAFFRGMGRSRHLKELAIFGTNTILVEMPFSAWSSSEMEEIYFLRESLGLIPIIAHIERYMKYQSRSTIKKMIANGALIQSNAGYFLDPKLEKKAIKQFASGDIHLIGSDCHNMRARPQNLRRAISLLEEQDVMHELEQLQLLQNYLLKDAIPIHKI